MAKRDRLRLLAVRVDDHHRVQIGRRLRYHGDTQRDQRLDRAVEPVAVEHPIDGTGEVVAAAPGLQPPGGGTDRSDQRRFVREVGAQAGVGARPRVDLVEPAQDRPRVGP